MPAIHGQNRRRRTMVVKKHGLGNLMLCQFPGLNHGPCAQPERALLGAVLEEAMLTLAKYRGKPDARSRKLADDALHWVETRGDGQRYFTFDDVCFALELNADRVRQEMHRALRQGIDLAGILRRPGP